MRASWEAAEDNFILRHEIEIFYGEIDNRIDQTKLIKIYLNFCKRVSRIGSRCQIVIELELKG